MFAFTGLRYRSMGIWSLPRLILVACTLPALLPLSALSQSITCNQTDLVPGLTPCLPYFEAGNATTPGYDCCPLLATLLYSDPTCMCLIGAIGGQFNLPLDEVRALQVVALCNLTLPPSVQACSGPNVYVPTSAPFGLMSETPAPTTGSDDDVGVLGIGTCASPSMILSSGVLAAPIWAILPF